MRTKRATAALLAILSLAAFIPGCSSFSETEGLRNAWGPWSWLKTKTARTTEIERFASKIRPQPGNPVAHYNLGSYYLQAGRYNEAIWELSKAVTIKPDYFEAFNLLAVSHDRLADFHNAEKAYRTALQINPNAAYIHNNMGHSFILREKWQEALETLRKAAELNGSVSNPRLFNNLGIAWAMTGHDGEGLAAFERAGGKAEAHHKMARVYEYKGMVDEAAKEYAIALDLNPSSGTYRERLNECRQNVEAIRFAQQIRQAMAQSQPSPSQAKGKTPDMLFNEVGIEISNGSGIGNLARKIGRFLKERGFAVVRLTNAESFDHNETRIYYRKGYDAASRALAERMPEIPSLEETKRFDRPEVKIRMVLGRDLAAHRDKFAEDSGR